MFYQLQESFEEIKNENVKNDEICFINIDKIMYREAIKFIKNKYTIVMGNYKTRTIIDTLNIKKVFQ